jgi:DNA-binding HxlR family transcriptional regulator
MTSGCTREGDALTKSGEPGPDAGWDRVEEVLAEVNGTWAAEVLRHLGNGWSRPGELLDVINRSLPAGRQRLSRTVLTEVLGRLHTAGHISRKAEEYPRKVHYRLTDSGHELLSDVNRLDGGDSWWASYADEDAPPPGVDPTVQSPARVWNYAVGGRDNFAVDRAAGDAVAKAMPTIAVTARLGRAFQTAAVGQLVDPLGVTQFLDIGTGLPTAGAVHEVAQRAAPESRVVYVDNDPSVLAHARALLTSTPEGACAFAQADVREPGKVLEAAARTLDLTQPVAVLLMMVMHFVPDDAEAFAIARALSDGIRGPMYLVMAHAAADTAPEQAAQASQAYNRRAVIPVRLRTRPQVEQIFAAAGAELFPPGVMSLGEWQAQEAGGLPVLDVNGHVGIGRRPALG